MRATYLGMIAALSVVGPTVLSACGSDDGSEKQVQGSVSVALTGVSSSGISYRLRTGNFAITGPKAVNFGTEADLAATTRSFELPAGDYLIRLKAGWTMERFNGMTWETVEAILLSANPVGFEIIDQQRTGVVFLFRAGDDVIPLGNGVVDVSIAVDDGMSSCPAGLVQCAGVCVNPASDPINCGACGNVCMPGTGCDNGNCVGMGCPMGQVDCGAVCVDLGTDPNNCGACSQVCPAGQACSNGNCIGMGCPTEMGFVDCGGACVFPMSDPNNCGACGNVCMPGMGCENGNCVATGCPMGQVDCGGACVDPASDSTNCGACGNICAPGSNCTAGACTCQVGFTDCDLNPANGCEVNAVTDANNCGACGNVCPPSQLCSEGVCSSLMCQPGFADCNSNVNDGCEIDISKNLLHCGSCGAVCNTPNAAAICLAGSCQIAACNLPFANCDGNVQNGCESNQAPPTICGAQTLAPIPGDAGAIATGASGFGANSIRLTILETDFGPIPHDLGVMLNLTPPPGASYTMEVACDGCGTAQVGNQLFVRWQEAVPFSNSSTRDVLVTIRYAGGSSCAPWTFQATGNVLTQAPTCSPR